MAVLQHLDEGNLHVSPHTHSLTDSLTHSLTHSQVAMNRKAVALGIRKADGGFLLSPRKKTKITLVEGDQIIVIADFE